MIGNVPTDSAQYYSVSDANLLAHPVVRRVAEHLSEQCARVLDIGCGTGAFGTLLDEGSEYVGVDLNVEGSELQFRCSHRLISTDACVRLPFESSDFDAIVSFWCLEHLPNPVSTLEECARVLRPGGLLVLVFPNYDNPFRRCPSWWVSHYDEDSLQAAIRRMKPSDLWCQATRRATYIARQFSKQLRQDVSRHRLIFEINSDPACDRLNWSRDRDAIHIASSRSIVRFLESREFQSTTIPGCEEWFVRRHWLFNQRPEQCLAYRSPVE